MADNFISTKNPQKKPKKGKTIEVKWSGRRKSSKCMHFDGELAVFLDR
jgi:hypothetical protein